MKTLLLQLVCFAMVLNFNADAENLIKEKNVKENSINWYDGIFTRDYEASNFDAVVIGNAFKINIQRGENFSVKVSGSEQDLKMVAVKVHDNELNIKIEKEFLNFSNEGELSVEITMPHLRKLDLNGATVTTVKGFEEDAIAIDVSGASTAKLYLNSKTVDLDVSGASTVQLVGLCAELRCELSGASSFNGYGCEADNVVMDASGASSAKVFANRKLVADASGASSITYKGDARVEGDSSMASSIKKMN